MDMRKNITRFWSEVDDEKNRRILDAYFHNFIFLYYLRFQRRLFFSRSEYLLSYLFCLHRLLKNYING